MKLPPVPHSWRLSPRAAARLQRALAPQIVFHGRPDPVRWVAGLDAAFSPDGGWVLAGVVLWDAVERRVEEQHTARRRLTFPYVPGLLSFREAPALLAALRRLRRRPDVLLCDGQGRAHPRRFGIACHVGLLTGIPALGCAKSLLVGTHAALAASAGSVQPLTDRGEVVGEAVRTRAGVKPVYVSPGHLLDLAAARTVVLSCATGSRLPEPTRLADRLVSEYRRAAERAAA